MDDNMIHVQRKVYFMLQDWTRYLLYIYETLLTLSSIHSTLPEPHLIIINSNNNSSYTTLIYFSATPAWFNTPSFTTSQAPPRFTMCSFLFSNNYFLKILLFSIFFVLCPNILACRFPLSLVVVFCLFLFFCWRVGVIPWITLLLHQHQCSTLYM